MYCKLHCILHKKYTIYLTEKKENSSYFFRITVNENPLYLKIWSNLIPTSSLEGYTVSRKVLIVVPKTDWQFSSRNIYVSEISIFLKTHFQKSGYILKVLTPIYTLDCNVFWINKHKVLSNYHQLLSFYAFINLFIFWRKIPTPFAPAPLFYGE